jgi:hypothetical protein
VDTAGGQVNSGTATLTVNPLIPTITDPPGNLTVLWGETASLHVGALGAVSYQWQKAPIGSGSFVNLNDGGRISGANTATLVLINVEEVDEARYRCLASGGSGGQANSGSATLTVAPTPPPVITSAPTNTTASLGQAVSFHVGATGALTYIWQKAPIGGGSFVTMSDTGRITGTATPTLIISNVGTGDEARHRCLVSNGAGAQVNSGSATFTLVAAPPPTITSLPSSLTVNAGETGYFNITATNAVTYIWQKAPIGGGSFVSLSDGAKINGSATPNLLIFNTTESDEARYRCLVGDGYGSQANSGAVILTVN